jgi:hypothetical protein
MPSSLPDLQKERGFPHPSRKKKLLKFKRESTRYPLIHKKQRELRKFALRFDSSKKRFEIFTGERWRLH